MRSVRVRLAFVLAIWASGCAPAPRTAPIPFSKTDQEVITTLIQREFMYRRGASRVLVADRTMAECHGEQSAQVGIDCFVTPNQRMPLQTHRPWSLNLPHLFRNVESRKVTLPAIEGVTVVSMKDPRFRRDGPFSVAELRRGDTRDDGFFVFSVPVYLSQRQAVVFYRLPNDYSGFAYMVREKHGWVIRERAVSMERRGV